MIEVISQIPWLVFPITFVSIMLLLWHTIRNISKSLYWMLFGIGTVLLGISIPIWFVAIMLFPIIGFMVWDIQREEKEKPRE